MQSVTKESVLSVYETVLLKEVVGVGGRWWERCYLRNLELSGICKTKSKKYYTKHYTLTKLCPTELWINNFGNIYMCI